MIKQILVVSVLAFSTAMTTASLAQAASDSTDSKADAKADAKEGCANCSEHDQHEQHERWMRHAPRVAVSISPQYYSLNTAGYASAFTGNGFTAPQNGAVGLTFTLYATTERNWQLGLGYGTVSYSNDNGANEAAYNQNYVGIWVGREFDLCESFEVSIGTVLSWGHAKFEELSTTANGRTTEDAFLAQPKILVAYRIARGIRLGVSATYNEPMGENVSVKGQGLTTGEISLHGFNAGIEFIIGRFDAPTPHEEPGA